MEIFLVYSPDYKEIEQIREQNRLFVGDTGFEKSYSAISITELIEPEFIDKRIVLTVQ